MSPLVRGTHLASRGPWKAQEADPSNGAPPFDKTKIPTDGQWTVVADPTTSAAVIIDPVLDYDRPTRAVATASADTLLSLVEQKRYRVDMILDTHAHADHLTAASYL